MTYEPGKTLSHFRLIEKIGEGGMGVVWKAEDEKLQRVVALKVLPPEKLADEERRLRFVREARTAAAVTHPNIAVVYAIDEADDVVFIAIELIEGKTLREVIGGKPMPLREALRLGVEIAEGLSAAHQAKVIHRDLKPDNVIVAPGGHVKILDFGLAKLLEERAAIDPEEASKLATVSDEMTQAGRVLGTAAYMSPEQARGLAVDARSDLFSFGIVLYEMVTGKAPFRGSTSMDTLTAILREQPVPAVQLNPEVPAELERILGKCLEKEPGERYQHAQDLVVDLRKVKRDTESQPLRKAEVAAPTAAVAGSRRAVWKPLVWSAAALLLIGIAGVASWKFLPIQKPEKELTQRQLTFNPDETPVRSVEISPDGRYVAYLDGRGLQVQRIENGDTQPLRLPEGFSVFDAHWLPDGTGIILRGAESLGQPVGLWNVSLLGGRPRRILDENSWFLLSPDGKHIAYMKADSREIWIAGPSGESPRQVLVAGEDRVVVPVAWSPTSSRLAYAKQLRSLEISLGSLSLDGGPTEEILSGPTIYGTANARAFCWLRDGRLVYAGMEPPPNETDTNLFAVDVDPSSGKRSGEPRRLTNGVGAQFASLSATADGSRLAVLKRRLQSDVYVADLDGRGLVVGRPRRLTLEDRNDRRPIWTPDSQFVVFSSDRRGSWDVFRQRIDTTDAEAVIVAPGQQFGVTVTPDGGSVLYREGEGKVNESRFMRVPFGGGPQQQLAEAGEWQAAACPTTRGASCVVLKRDGDAYSFFAWDPDKGLGANLGRSDPFWRFSPDVTQTAGFVIGENGARISLRSIPRGRSERNIQLEKDLGVSQASRLAWSAASDAIYVSADKGGGMGLFRVDLKDGSASSLGVQTEDFSFFSASPDGRHLAYEYRTGDSNVWLLENF